MVKHDVGIRIRADAKFARLINKAAQLSGNTRSGFIRDAALILAKQVIQGTLCKSDMKMEGRRKHLVGVYPPCAIEDMDDPEGDSWGDA